MRWIARILVTASVLSIIVLLLLKNHLEDIWDQYNVSAYVHASLRNTFHHSTLEYHAPLGAKVGDKIIIMAKLEKEDTEWVGADLPDWQRAIYTVNPTSPTLLSTPMNKGHESMAYLSYIIDHYDSLPATLAFLHSHRAGFLTAWHTDTPLHDNVVALRTLQIPFVQENGYVNLRCNWNPGCEEAHRFNKHVTPAVWQDVFAGTSTLRTNLSSLDSETRAPAQVAAACCAQFAVSRDRVRQRPLSDYERFRQWIVDTEIDDAKSGRIMEFLWHVIFGMDPV